MSKISPDLKLPSGLIGAIASFAAPIARDMIERNEAVIRLRKKFQLEHEHLPDQFGTVYAYTLIEYGVGKEEQLLRLFDQEEIKQAFRAEFEQNNLFKNFEAAVEESVNWELYDWNTLGRKIEELQANQQVNLHQEIEEFKKTFYKKVLPRTLKPSQVMQDRKLQEILKELDKLDDLNEIRKVLKEILQLLKSRPNHQGDLTQHSASNLSPSLEETLELYLAQCFRDDRFAKLEQAGEKDSDGDTKLVRVFIDLDVTRRKGALPRDLRLENFLKSDTDTTFFVQRALEGSSFSAMECLLKEYYPKVVIIGGPGQGKSTLGQQLAQVHRAKLLNEPYDDKYQPKITRLPFQVVLKDFAQWLANEPEIDALEAYLAERVGNLAKRPGEVTCQNIQEVLRNRDCLLLLDGLDEVVVPKLQRQMLDRIKDFLSDAERLGAKLFVVATSRPNGYDNQFETEQFWHLELELLSWKKVCTYAEKWIEAKELSEDESCKILPTLKECKDDPSIAGLLATPLQVTIILIIIKSGRRPPSQREDLFNEYWLTIFRREEGKDRGKEIIKNKESHLLNLHAYLGYLLHRRAAEQDIKSLLSKEDFKKVICDFLRKKKGIRFSEEVIVLEMDQLVKEVGDRLILIVQKEKEFFGFELRSFQEFFAAVYLVQTAADTRQRFDRLKAIARYEHWRNVALFVAGRIARTFPGGEVLQLGQVWRAVDRDGVSRYLKPGAWFAVQIAADGALSDETDLQYSAIEDGLKVLETGLTREQQNQLKSLTKRLPQKEQDEILRPALEDKLRSLPESCLVTALDLYSQCFGATLFFQEKIEGLLQSQRENVVVSALKLALEHKTDPTWMVERLRNYLSYFKQQLPILWFRSQEYVEQLLSIWPLSNAEVTELAEATLSMWRYSSQYSDKEPVWALSEPKSLLEQLIMMLRCGGLSAYCMMNSNITERVDLDGQSEILLSGRSKSNPLLLVPDGAAEVLDSLLKRSDLMPALRIHLWRLFWFFKEPNRDNVTAFLEDFRAIQRTQTFPNSFWQRSFLSRTWPLLALAIERQKFERPDAVEQLLPFLDADTQLSIAERVAGVILEYVEKAEDTHKKQLVTALHISIGLEELLPELMPLANQMNLTIADLVGAYIVVYRSSSYVECTIDQLKNLLTTAEGAINDSEQLARLLNLLTMASWSYTPEILKQAKRLLEQILERWSDFPELSFASSTVTFFVKLLTYDIQVKPIAPLLFTTLFRTELVELSPWRMSNSWRVIL